MQQIMERISAWHLKVAYHAEMKNVLGNIDIIRRLDRAYEILTRDERYSIAVDGYMIFSVHSPNGTYTVIEAERSCTCPDGQILCKHRLAVRLILAAAKAMHADGIEFQPRMAHSADEISDEEDEPCND
jgi:hypothetical protein